MKKDRVSALRSMRDELRLKMHLAAMDLKTEWEKLEPQINKVVSEAAVVSDELLGDLEHRMQEFKKRLQH